MHTFYPNGIFIADYVPYMFEIYINIGGSNEPKAQTSILDWVADLGAFH